MSLSVANHTAFDFTKASSPLVSIAGEAVTVVNGGSINTTDGLVLNAWENAYVPCTPGGLLTGWAYPYTFVIIAKVTRTGASGSQNLLGMRTNSGMSSNLLGGKVNSTNGNYNPENSGYEYLIASNLADATDVIVILEMRANGLSVWHGTSLQNANTGQSLTMPTLNTTDKIVIGATDGNDPNINCKGFCLVPGALSSQDRTDIAADWRAAFAAASAGSAAKFSSGYHQRGLR